MSGRDHTWPVPYLREFQNAIEPGQSLNIKGFIIGKHRFDINLSTGARVSGNHRDNIALHISARLDEGKFVFNSLSDNEWGKEERQSLSFKEGQDFSLRIRAQQDCFEIYANGKEVAKYKYRVPLQQVRCVYVDGDVELHGVNWEGRYYSVPFHTAISMSTGKQLYVSGAADDKAKRFEINLKTGPDRYALHISIRFDEKVVVRNSKLSDGDWGVEEREGKFPFQRGHAFDVIVMCTDDNFSIFIDGKPYGVFKHRVSPNEVNELEIEGDVELQGLHW